MSQIAGAFPIVSAWPKCSQCGMAFVLRRCLSMSQGWMWLWQRECYHKTAAVVFVEEEVGDVAGASSEA